MARVFYLSGVMQGSRTDTGQVDQDYRRVLKKIIAEAFPDAELKCPLDLFPDALLLDEVNAKEIVPKCAEIARQADVIVAFLPEASLGTAVELWEAHKNSRLNIIISPMKHNLMLRTVSDFIVDSVDDFKRFITSDYFAQLLEERIYP